VQASSLRSSRRLDESPAAGKKTWAIPRCTQPRRSSLRRDLEHRTECGDAVALARPIEISRRIEDYAGRWTSSRIAEEVV